MAALDAMTAKAPKKRYLVAPIKREADMTIRGALTRVVQLNHNHAYSLTADEIKTLLDELINAAEIN